MSFNSSSTFRMNRLYVGDSEPFSVASMRLDFRLGAKRCSGTRSINSFTSRTQNSSHSTVTTVLTCRSRSRTFILFVSSLHRSQNSHICARLLWQHFSFNFAKLLSICAIFTQRWRDVFPGVLITFTLPCNC